MPRPSMAHYKILVKGLPTYTCDVCKITAVGNTVRIELEDLAGVDAAGVGAILEQCPIYNGHMPEGWAGYGIRSHRCPGCKV